MEDISDTIEVVVFPKTYTKVQIHLQEGNKVVIAGKISVRDGEDQRSVLCDKLLKFEDEDIPRVTKMLKSRQWYDSLEKDTGPATIDFKDGLSIRMPLSPTHQMIQDLRAIFVESPGTDQVYLVVESKGSEKRVATEYRVEKSMKLLKRVEEVVGAENVLR